MVSVEAIWKIHTAFALPCASSVRFPEDTASEEFDNRRNVLSDALSVLNERDRRIFEGRCLVEDPITLAELAGKFGLSRERVRQIETCAFEKVQKAVKNRVAAIQTPIHQPMH